MAGVEGLALHRPLPIFLFFPNSHPVNVTPRTRTQNHKAEAMAAHAGQGICSIDFIVTQKSHEESHFPSNTHSLAVS